jgi:hypothetical protein
MRPAGPPPRQQQDRTAKFQKPRLTVTPPADVPSATAGGPPGPGGPPGEARRSGKPKTLPKLSTDALAGKAPLGSFAELEAFFKTKDAPPTPPAPASAEAPPAPPVEPPADGAPSPPT